MRTSSKSKASHESSHGQAFRKTSEPYKKPFPINNLASLTQQTPPSLASLPLSPTSSVASTLLTELESEYDDGNEMEWTPTKPTFSNLQPMKPLNMFSEPQMTDKVNLLGYSLRNDPPSDPKEIRSTQSIQSRPFSTIQDGFSSTSSGVKKLRQNPNGELNESEGAGVSQKGRMTLSESKLKLPEGIIDTGLEPLFEKFFAIRDEPLEIANTLEYGAESNPEISQKSHSKIWLMTTTASFFIGVVGIAMHFYH